MSDLVSVDLNGLGGPELEEAYALITKLGAGNFILHVDKRVFASSVTPKALYKFTDKRAPLGSVDVRGLKMQLKAVEAAAALIDSELLSDPEVIVERASIEEVKAEVKTSELDEEGSDDEDVRARAKDAGISNYWNKSIEKLEAELAELD